MDLPEPSEHIAEQHKWDADTDDELAVLAALQRSRAVHCASHLIEAESGLMKEPFASWCRPNSGVATFEKLRADAMFQASDASTYC